VASYAVLTRRSGPEHGGGHGSTPGKEPPTAMPAPIAADRDRGAAAGGNQGSMGTPSDLT
jgi:hypothetical protein